MADAGTKQRGNAAAVGCVAGALLWVVLLLHIFAERIWDEEPAVLRWGVIVWGGLLLLGLVASLAFGKRDEKIYALVFLAVVGLFVAFTPPREDRQAAAAVGALVRELAEKGEQLERHADSLPEVAGKPARDDVVRHLGQAQEDLREAADLLRRARELLRRAPRDKREELDEALARFNARAGRAQEKFDKWVEKVLKKSGGPKGPEKSG
jgi:hypothetical protein